MSESFLIRGARLIDPVTGSDAIGDLLEDAATHHSDGELYLSFMQIHENPSPSEPRIRRMCHGSSPQALLAASTNRPTVERLR